MQGFSCLSYGMGGLKIMTMGERIREKRIETGISQTELAKKLKIDKTTISKYESGKIKNPKINNIILMANIFGCSVSYLMGFESEE